jgi:hypothetical protein
VWTIEQIAKIFITNKRHTRCHIIVSICTFFTWQKKCTSPKKWKVKELRRWSKPDIVSKLAATVDAAADDDGYADDE